MSYHIQLSPDSDYVALFHAGNVTLAELEQARFEAAQLMDRQSCRKILVDVCAMTNTLSTTEQFEFTSGAARILPPGTQVAVLVRMEVLPDARFSETVALNRGINMKMFINKNDAIQWLRG